MVGQPPPEARAFLNASSGYVFFRFGAEHPKGTAGCELTPWVSMAVDPARPTAWRHRFLRASGTAAGHPGEGLGFAHDTGGAIRLRAHRHVHRGRRRRPSPGHDHLQSGAGLAVVGETVSLPEKVRLSLRGVPKSRCRAVSAPGFMHSSFSFPQRTLAQNTETEGGSPPGLGAEVRLLKKHSELW